jgi:hypothetical protein
MLGQQGRGGTGVIAVAALVSVVLVSAVGVATFRSDTAGAQTVLLRGTDATLTLAGGERRAAVEGEPVPAGATVLAGRGGAVLATAQREVHLYPATDVTVFDGVHQVLGAGSVIIDASAAPGMNLDTPAAAVTARDGALVRVDGGPLTRVGVLRTGDADQSGAEVRATGRRAPTQVEQYYQVQVANGGLPGNTTPLLLTGDDYELALARDLVLADRMLNDIGRRLVGTGIEGGVVLAALRTAVPDIGVVAANAPDTERALGYLVATSAEAAGRSQAERFDRVRELRSAGGSWGVVAALVDSTVDGVGARLAQLLAPSALVLAVQQEPVPAPNLFSFDPPAAAPDPAPRSTSQASAPPAGPAPAPTRGGTAGAPPAPRPAPVPVPAPVLEPVLEPVTGVVTGVVETLLEIVDLGGSGGPPSPTVAPTSPSPSPAPLLNLPLLR